MPNASCISELKILSLWRFWVCDGVGVLHSRFVRSFANDRPSNLFRTSENGNMQSN
jgi:hypothetical protein